MQREGLFFPFVRHIDKVIVEIRNIFIANNAMLANYSVILHKTSMCNDEIKPNKNSIGRERLISKMAF